ncbi:MAG TPA: AraC family transcriptional regulator [Micromonosporaceae bacterium]
MADAIERAVERVIATMRENLGEPLTVDDMARVAMFSKFHFTRIFQRVTGVSPGRFLSALRLQHAKHLLVSTTLNVADISVRVGYNSVGTFSSRFTKSVGLSPTTYRRMGGYTPQIPTDNPGDSAGTGIVSGQIWPAPNGEPGLVFVGLFPSRIPEGKPARCTILENHGPFTLDRVPEGSWYLLAQSVPCRMEEATGPTSQNHVSVAAYGPVEVGPDSIVTGADLRLKLARALDPPVLLALLDVRKIALSQTETVPVADTCGRQPAA